MLVSLLFAGCSDDGGDAVSSPAQSKQESRQTEAKPVRDKVLVTVNGRELHKTNIAEKVEMMVALMAMSNPKVSLEDLKKLRHRLEASYPKVFVREVVFGDYAAKEKVVVDEESLSTAKKRVLSAFRGASRPKFDNVRRKLGSHARAFDEYVQMQALGNAVFKHILAAHPLNLPPNYAAEQCLRNKAYNADMALTNALVYARATNVWEKLKAGADFKESAKQFSEVDREAKDGGEWGTLGLQQLEPDEDLVTWAQKLQVGEFSPPIEGDNGLMILRLDSKKGEDYTFSRIYFKLPMFRQELSEEELLAYKRKQHESEVLAREVKALLKSADVVWPKKKGKVRKEKARKGRNSGRGASSREVRAKKTSGGESATVKQATVKEATKKEATDRTEQSNATKTKKENSK